MDDYSFLTKVSRILIFAAPFLGIALARRTWRKCVACGDRTWPRRDAVGRKVCRTCGALVAP